ncbi:hypothetical protein CF68_02710 [Cupriavidus sp. SK-4]|nr:hypothetical protein CF68_02710 [Cupriavidus sp. SK-4]
MVRAACKNLDRFNELLSRLKQAVPDMIIQVGGSISFAPVEEGAPAEWLSDETRHMLARLKPTPEQVTVAVNTGQMNTVEIMTPEDCAGTSFERKAVYDAYEEMIVPAGPAWLREHLAQLAANGIQPKVVPHVTQAHLLVGHVRTSGMAQPVGRGTGQHRGLGFPFGPARTQARGRHAEHFLQDQVQRPA